MDAKADSIQKLNKLVQNCGDKFMQSEVYKERSERLTLPKSLDSNEYGPSFPWNINEENFRTTNYYSQNNLQNQIKTNYLNGMGFLISSIIYFY